MESTNISLQYNFTNAKFNELQRIQFKSLVSPLLQMIQNKLEGNYMYAEGYLISSLKQNKTGLTKSDFIDLSKHMSACIFHVYLIVMMMLLSVFIGYPLICCFNVCNRKISDPTRNPYQLCTQSVLLFTTMCFLLVGAGSSWHAGFEMQTAIEILPSAARNAVKNVDIAIDALKAEGRAYNKSIAQHLDDLRKSNEKVPGVLYIFDKTVDMKYWDCVNRFKAILGDLFDIFGALDFTKNQAYLSKIESKYAAVQVHAKEYNLTLPAVRLRKFYNSTLFYDPRNHSSWPNVINKWTEIRNHIENINNSIPYRDILKFEVLHVTKINEEAIKMVEAGVDNVSQITTNAVSTVFSEKIRRTIERSALKVKQVLSKTHLTKDPNSRYFKLTAYILLLPSTLGFVVFAFFVLGYVRSCKDIQNSSHGKLKDCKSLLFFKLAINFSIPFLWIILLGAAILYCIHVPTAIFCGLVENNQILTNYFDLPLWNNTTYLSNKINKYLPNSTVELRVAEVLKTCREGTIYNYSNLDELTSRSFNPNQLDEVIQNNIYRILSIFQNVDFANYGELVHAEELMHLLNLTLTEEILEEASHNLKETKKTIDNLTKIFDNIPFDRTILEDLLYLVKTTDNMEVSLKRLTNIKFQVINNVLVNLRQFNETAILWTLNYDNRALSEIHRYLISLNMNHLTQKMKNITNDSLYGKMGNCSFLPDTYYTINHMICEYALVVLNTLWLSLVILSGSILVAAILSCKLAQYVRGALRNQQRQMLELQRYSSFQSQTSTETTEVHLEQYKTTEQNKAI